MSLDDKLNEREIIKNIINTMFLLMKHLRVYDAQNKLVEATTSRLLHFLASSLKDREDLSFSVARHGFIYNEDFIDRKNKTFESFAYLLFQHGIAVITINKNVTANDLHTLLTLVTRSPAESWEEGGMARSLQMRHLETITVREMSEQDIDFVEGGETSTRDERIKQKSALWDRFSSALFHGLSASRSIDTEKPAEVSPDTLAELTNTVFGRMSKENQQKFIKGLSHYLATLQNEKITPYRLTALAKLTEYINRIAPAIRGKLFQHIFNLNLQPDFSEEFYFGLSDEIIIEILEQSTQDNSYVPPVILKLLSKFAGDKSLVIEDMDKLDQKISASRADIVKLFQKDDFEKFVPDQYRDALINIIQHESIPKEAGKHLVELKMSLEEDQLEKHSADIILKILDEAPDPEHFAGMDANLVGVLTRYLEQGDFQKLNTLWDLCLQRNREDFTRTHGMFSSADFTGPVIEGIAQHGKPAFAAIEKLMVKIGEPFISPLLNKLTVETNRTLRTEYLHVLQKLNTERVVLEAVKHLEDPHWVCVRNILLLLRALNKPKLLPHIRPLRHHPHLKVRTEALRACLQYDDRESSEILLQMLGDNDPKTVESAIFLAMVDRGTEVVARLIEMLQENAVLDYRFEQKKVIVQTLAEIAPARAAQVFSQLLTSRNLIHPNQHSKLKEEALKAFGRLDGALIEPYLAELVANTKGDIRNKLQFLLRKSGG